MTSSASILLGVLVWTVIGWAVFYHLAKAAVRNGIDESQLREGIATMIDAIDTLGDRDK